MLKGLRYGGANHAHGGMRHFNGHDLARVEKPPRWLRERTMDATLRALLMVPLLEINLNQVFIYQLEVHTYIGF